MGLRSFHLLFIVFSVLLAAFFAAWAGGQYQLEHETVYAVTATGSLIAGAGLTVYGARFQKKTKAL
jgi:hypothetical protein